MKGGLTMGDFSAEYLEALRITIEKKLSQNPKANIDEIRVYLQAIYDFSSMEKGAWNMYLNSDYDNPIVPAIKKLDAQRKQLESMLLEIDDAMKKNHNSDQSQSTNFNLMKQIPYKSLFPVESNRVYFLESEYLEIIDKTCIELEKEMNNYTIEQSSVLNQNVLKDEEEINRLVDEAVKKDPLYVELMNSHKSKMAEIESALKNNSDQDSLNAYLTSFNNIQANAYEEIYNQKRQELINKQTKTINDYQENLKNKTSELYAKGLTVIRKTVSQAISKRFFLTRKNGIAFSAEVEKMEKAIIAENVGTSDEAVKKAPQNEIIKDEKVVSSDENIVIEIPQLKTLDDILNLIKSNAADSATNSGKVEWAPTGFMDNADNEQLQGVTADYKKCQEREVAAFKSTFGQDRAQNRGLQDQHLSKIKGIHTLLRNNKKVGFSGNSTEYKAVLTALQNFEDGLTNNLSTAEKIELLNNVYDSAENYMKAKGPQKKYWGHGEARYELMYLLCNEIYSYGGPAAEGAARVGKLQKDLDNNLRFPEVYEKQIPNYTNAQESLDRKYNNFLTDACQKLSTAQKNTAPILP